MAFWKMGEADGEDRPDSSGNGKTLTNNNGAILATGLIGGATGFDGVNQSLSRASFLNTASAFTVTGWVKGPSAVQDSRVLFKSADGSSTGIIIGNDVGNGNFYAYVNVGGTVISSDPVDLSDWVFFAVRYKGTGLGIDFSVNGGTPGVSTDDYPGSTGIFTLCGGDVFFEGFLDAVGVWSRALTNPEVAALYNAGAGLEHPF